MRRGLRIQRHIGRPVTVSDCKWPFTTGSHAKSEFSFYETLRYPIRRRIRRGVWWHPQICAKTLRNGSKTHFYKTEQAVTRRLSRFSGVDKAVGLFVTPEMNVSHDFEPVNMLNKSGENIWTKTIRISRLPWISASDRMFLYRTVRP